MINHNNYSTGMRSNNFVNMKGMRPRYSFCEHKLDEVSSLCEHEWNEI